MINGRWKRLAIVGLALSPEYVYEVGVGRDLPRQPALRRAVDGRKALAAAFNMEGAFNDVALSLAAGAAEADVDRATRPAARPLRRTGRLRPRESSSRTASSPTRSRRTASRRRSIPAIFLAVAAFLLNIVLSRLMALQRTEIGLLKAFGYTDGERRLALPAFALVTVGRGRRARDGARHLRRYRADRPVHAITTVSRSSRSSSARACSALTLRHLGGGGRRRRARRRVSARPAPAAGRSDAAGAACALPRRAVLERIAPRCAAVVARRA